MAASRPDRRRLGFARYEPALQTTGADLDQPADGGRATVLGAPAAV